VNVYTLAAVSFTLGLITREIIDGLIYFAQNITAAISKREIK